MIGSEEDRTIHTPDTGVWGVRIYNRLRDVRGGDQEAFPETHYWASAGDVLYERLRYPDGHETHHGEGDSVGIVFLVRGVEGPDHYDTDYDVAWAFRGNWDG